MRVGETAEVFEIAVAIEREDRADPVTPRGGARIESGDLLTAYSTVGTTPAVTGVFGHYEDQSRRSPDRALGGASVGPASTSRRRPSATFQ